MQILIEVLKDLLKFCLNLLSIDRGVESTVQHDLIVPKKVELMTVTKPTSLPPPSHFNNHLKKKEISSFGDRAYVSVDKTPFLLRPVWSFDGVLFSLSYAEPVRVLGYEGRYARVSTGDTFGFILKDELTTNLENIFPEFKTGEIYSANHPDTKKVRRKIDDEFFSSNFFLPLQSVEFVTYRLAQEGRKITWPNIRPRLAGMWFNILKGQIGIQVGIYPKSGSLIEYQREDGSGFIGYTKSVHVDESIIIHGVGRLIEGEYREEAISKIEWQEWKAVWITAS